MVNFVLKHKQTELLGVSIYMKVVSLGVPLVVSWLHDTWYKMASALAASQQRCVA